MILSVTIGFLVLIGIVVLVNEVGYRIAKITGDSKINRVSADNIIIGSIFSIGFSIFLIMLTLVCNEIGNYILK